MLRETARRSDTGAGLAIVILRRKAQTRSTYNDRYPFANFAYTGVALWSTPHLKLLCSSAVFHEDPSAVDDGSWKDRGGGGSASN